MKIAEMVDLRVSIVGLKSVPGRKWIGIVNNDSSKDSSTMVLAITGEANDKHWKESLRTAYEVINGLEFVSLYGMGEGFEEFLNEQAIPEMREAFKKMGEELPEEEDEESV